MVEPWKGMGSPADGSSGDTDTALCFCICCLGASPAWAALLGWSVLDWGEKREVWRAREGLGWAGLLGETGRSCRAGTGLGPCSLKAA